MSASALDARNPFLVLIWAFGLFTLMHGHQYIGALVASLGDRVSFDSIMSGKHETPRTLLIRGSFAMIVGLPLVWLCLTLLWKRPVAWMGLGPQWGRLLLGMGLGVGAPVLVVLSLWRMNLARISFARTGWVPSQIASAVLGLLAVAVFAGVSEEIAFRGMMGLELSLTWGWPLAVVASGAVFGVVHLLGQIKTLNAVKAGAVMVSSIAISFLFISLYRFSGSLWLPIGFHIAWNCAHSLLLGLRMNGKEPLASYLKTTLDGSSWIAGGDAGMEASAPAIAVYCLIGLLFTVL